MPAKKKSCFQITSVTQAQVAAVGAADDTESLDDPDESRTEDVSSEIYDMSRAEHEPACDRSSSEEALNNVGEPAEAGGVTLPSGVPPAGQLPAPLGNPVGELRKVGVSGPSQSGQQPPGIGVTSGLPPVTQPGGIQPQPPPVAASTGPAGLSLNASHPAAPPATSTVSCSSRFRVIKLDHGTGEPFRRGRWTCTEFYEKDSDASLSGRTVDSIRHASVTLDPAADRDSGLGLTGGSVVSPATHSSLGLGSAAEASHSSARVHPGETLPQQQILQQGYGGGTSATHGSFSGVQPTGPGPAPSAVGGPQPPAGQNVLPVGQNGLPQPGVHMQKSPVMPPSAQPVAYHPQQQGPVGHHLTGQSSGPIQSQTEYYQQQQQQSTPMPPAHATGQSLPGVPQAAGQGPAAAMPPAPGAASVPGQGADAPGAGGGAASAGLAAPAVLQQQTVGLGGTGGSIMVGGSTLPQPPASQYAAAGQPHPLGHPAASGVQTVPAIAVSSSVSTNVPAAVPTAVPSASSAAMPNATSSGLPPGHISHSRTPVALGMQGLPMTGFGLMEGMQSPIISGRELVKPFMPESLQLTTPTVNSLFGIHIPVDGEEDRPDYMFDRDERVEASPLYVNSRGDPAPMLIRARSSFDSPQPYQTLSSGLSTAPHSADKGPDSGEWGVSAGFARCHVAPFFGHSGSGRAIVRASGVTSKARGTGGVQVCDGVSATGLDWRKRGFREPGAHGGDCSLPLLNLAGFHKERLSSTVMDSLCFGLTKRAIEEGRTFAPRKRGSDGSGSSPVRRDGPAVLLSGRTPAVCDADEKEEPPPPPGRSASSGVQREGAQHLSRPLGGGFDTLYSNPSTAFYQAFQYGSRLRDSKAHSDSNAFCFPHFDKSQSQIEGKVQQGQQPLSSGVPRISSPPKRARFGSASEAENGCLTPPLHPNQLEGKSPGGGGEASCPPPSEPERGNNRAASLLKSEQTEGVMAENELPMVLGPATPDPDIFIVEIHLLRHRRGSEGVTLASVQSLRFIEREIPPRPQRGVGAMRCPLSVTRSACPGDPSRRVSSNGRVYRTCGSASGTNIVAIDNKIEQAMDLVKSHLMYAVREEVEVLKEQIKELYERNSVLERENAVLKSLANSEQLSQLSTQSAATPPQQGLNQPQPQQQQQQQHPQPQPQPQPQLQLQHHPKPQQLQTQPQLDPGKQLQPNVTSA
ncbi:unnamed protein product [Menidia menidia]|uniref:(Atlantic silverside) hypothetical protein n=1 Tax=Menidia menidia TaxID=238744 RepID=A0A8S4AWH8_9TELE|nr:unnamed protein product [Menidia menidia]